MEQVSHAQPVRAIMGFTTVVATVPYAQQVMLKSAHQPTTAPRIVTALPVIFMP